MQEIEIKAKLENEAQVLAKLTELGAIFSGPAVQDDTIYVAETGSLESFLSNSLFLRLRVIDGSRTVFTAKYHQNREAANDTYATEYEVDISSRDMMEQIVLLQGYAEAVRVQKTRRTAAYQGWEICLDEVEGLGSFIEVEQLAEDGADPRAIYENLKAFLVSIGVPESAVTTMRYDIMLLTKQSS